jgi:hypothetical protein
VNTHSGAPGFATRRHSPSQSAHQYANDRWSRLSPPNAGRSIFVPFIVYFIAGGSDRSPRVNPPDEYGGSVMTASTLASSIDRSTASASPWCSTHRPPAPTIGAGRPGSELAPSAEGEGREVASALIAPPIPTHPSRP